MKLYEELVWRDLIKDVSDSELAMDTLNNKKVKFYCGFDPTGQSLTVGHLVQVIRMQLLANHGHTPVVLIGGATGLIGDPRQTSERQLLSLETSLANAELIKKQINLLLTNSNTIFVNNHDWIKDIDMITFLRDYGKNFNINYMLSKETVQSRLATGISYTEFSYMLIQAIDFLTLYKEQDVKIQFGGSDQWGNITTGLELIRKVVGKNDAVGLSSPLLLKADGEKFGKSESGAIWLDKALTSPYEVYQYFLNTSDADISKYLRTLTLLEPKRIMELEELSKLEPEKREAQKVLASEVVRFMHGQEELDTALLVTESLFTGEFNDLPLAAFKELEKVLDNALLEEGTNIVLALVEAKLASSNREAREFIKNGAISINGNKVTDSEYTLTKEHALFDNYLVVKRGRKKNGIIVLK